MSATTPQELPNPFTPMAFLPPNIAFQLTVELYILVGTLGAFVWESVNTIPADYFLLTRHRITLPTVVYFSSRSATFIFLFCLTFVFTSPVGPAACHRLQLAIQISFPIALSTTALLFYFRVRAMYHDNKLTIAFFTLTWFGVVGGTVVPAQTAMLFDSLGPTRYCIDPSGLSPAVSAGLWTPFANDFLIFIAVTGRLLKNSLTEPTIKNKFRAVFFGTYLPSFSRVLLQDGQAYFLSTIVIHILTGITFFNTSIPQTYRGVLPIPNVMVINIMATRIYRNTKLGIFRELNPSTSTTQHDKFTRPLAFNAGLARHNESRADITASTGVWQSTAGTSTPVGRNQLDDEGSADLKLSKEGSSEVV